MSLDFSDSEIWEFEGGDNRQIDVLEDDITLELACFNKLNDQCDDIDTFTLILWNIRASFKDDHRR